MASEEIKELSDRMPTKYLRDFFSEKDIPYVEWTLYDVDGTEHHISNVVVVEHISLVSNDEAKKLAQVFRRLDSANADTNHFLKHLAGALINAGHAAAETARTNPDLLQDPVVRTGAGAGLGSLAGVILGSFFGGAGLGSVVGGAVGGYAAAPADRKSRGGWGGGIGGLFTPIGAVAGGAIGGRKPSKVRKKNQKLRVPNPALTSSELTRKLKF